MFCLTESRVGELDGVLPDQTASPSTTSVISWADINQRNPNLLKSVTELLETGLTPDELEDTNYIKYHHRTGLNSYLSENYASKFYYDGEEWPSVQHAYQVYIGLAFQTSPHLSVLLCHSVFHHHLTIPPFFYPDLVHLIQSKHNCPSSLSEFSFFLLTNICLCFSVYVPVFAAVSLSRASHSRSRALSISHTLSPITSSSLAKFETEHLHFLMQS